jgi:hypothetical protein
MRKPSTRSRSFVTLDLYETGHVIWALERECSRIRLQMKRMAADDRAEVQPLVDRLEEIASRLNARYEPARAAILSHRPLAEARNQAGEPTDAR